MLRLSAGGRALLADKMSDAANLALGAMVFGQFLSESPFSIGLMALGAMIWVCFVGCAVAVAERKG